MPLPPPLSPRGHGREPSRPRARSRQDAPRSPDRRKLPSSGATRSRTRSPRGREERGFTPSKTAVSVLQGQAQTADTAARPLPLGRAPVADRPRVSKRCQPAWSSTQDHRPLWAGHPGLAVELELPLAGGAARCQPLPMTCGDQWRRAAPRGQGAGFSWPRPTAEPRPPTRLCWVTRGCLLVYGACERFPCESGPCGGRSAPASIYVTVLKTDEMSVAPSGAFGDYRQNNLKDLLNIF